MGNEMTGNRRIVQKEVMEKLSGNRAIWTET